MMKFLLIFSLFFIEGCNKTAYSTLDCNLLGKAYEASLLKSDLLPQSWEEVKSKHHAFVTILGEGLGKEAQITLSNNFLLRLKTLVSLSCGVEPEDAKVIQKQPLQDGKISKISYLTHDYYHCVASIWKKNAHELFSKSCRKS